MKETLVAFVLVFVAFIGGMAVGLSKPQPTIEAKPGGGLVTPGTAVIAGEVQGAWMKIGNVTRIWLGAIPEPGNVIELELTGKALRVVRDGKPIGSVGEFKP